MIEIKNISKSFNSLSVLTDVNLTIGDGELVLLTGESGSGKTVFLKHINGLLKPDQGQVFLDGIEISNLSERELLAVRKRIGFVFQSDALFDSLNVYENLALFLRIHRICPKESAKERISAALVRVGLLGREGLLPKELSGGMRKRVAIAREIVRQPKYLLLDEPTANLDRENTENILSLIRELREEMKLTTVVVSHDKEVLKTLPGRKLLLERGRIKEL